jgi:hypothetical protein
MIRVEYVTATGGDDKTLERSLSYEDGDFRRKM